MNSKIYVSALIHYNEGSHLSADDEVLITVLAPAAGIVTAIIIRTGSKVVIYFIKEIQKRLNSPKSIPVTVNSNGNNSNRFRKTLYRVTPSLAIRYAIIIYAKLASSQFLRIGISSSFKVIDVIIVLRSINLIKDILNHYLGTRENVFRMAVKTLCWIVYSRERDKMVQLAFVIVTLLSAKLWSTKNRTIQRLLRIWVFITLLNLSNYIYVKPSLLRPLDIGVFGLPIVEYPIKELASFTENRTNSKISMIGKEDPLVLPLPLQKEMPKGIANDVELELNKMIKNSTLGEENIVFEKKEELYKEKLNRSKSTSRPKRRMNSLQELKKIPENVKSLPLENDFEKVYNATKIKAEKVQ